METPSVFKYQSAHRFLLDWVSFRQASDPAFSLRGLAKSMGLNSHVLLVLILQGKRSLTLRQVPNFARGIGLSSPERLYLQALIQYENASTPEEKNLCSLWLSEANPGRETQVREVEEFMAISHWVHMAILAMTENVGFVGTAEEIHHRLGKKATLAEVRSALGRLKSLGLVREQDGKLVCTHTSVTTKDDVANRGAREYYKQVSKLAVDAIDEQSVEEREFQAFAVSVPHAKVALAKEMIRKFRTQFQEAMTQEPGDEVYQAQFQFFRLTENPSEMVPKEDEGAGPLDTKKVRTVRSTK